MLDIWSGFIISIGTFFFFWKDIYREIRGKGVDSDREIEDNEEEVILIRRFLEEDFMLIFFMLR